MHIVLQRKTVQMIAFYLSLYSAYFIFFYKSIILLRQNWQYGMKFTLKNFHIHLNTCWKRFYNVILFAGLDNTKNWWISWFKTVFWTSVHLKILYSQANHYPNMKVNLLRPGLVKSFSPWIDSMEFVLLVTEPATSSFRVQSWKNKNQKQNKTKGKKKRKRKKNREGLQEFPP